MMNIKQISYDSFIHKFSWEDAVNVLYKGHFLPKADVEDMFVGPFTATLLNRGAYIKGIGYGVKAVTVIDDNKKRHLPTVHGIMLFYKDITGTLEAIIESSLVTEIKTASDSVLGARLLARKESKNLLIIGAGNLAYGLARAYYYAFPGIKKIDIWARTYEKAEKLVQKLKKIIPIEMNAVRDREEACKDADIISTATPANTPVLEGKWVKPGTHVDLIGAYQENTREADDTLLKKGTIFVDSRKTALERVGELMIPIKAGVISLSDIKGDLYDMVHIKNNRQDDKEITIYKNSGGGHLDTMISAYILENS